MTNVMRSVQKKFHILTGVSEYVTDLRMVGAEIDIPLPDIGQYPWSGFETVVTEFLDRCLADLMTDIMRIESKTSDKRVDLLEYLAEAQSVVCYMHETLHDGLDITFPVRLSRLRMRASDWLSWYEIRVR